MKKRLKIIKRSYLTQQRTRVKKARKLARHPLFAVPIMTFMVLLMIVVVGIVVFSGGHPKLRPSDSHIVILSYDKQEQTVPTRAATVGDLLNKLSITLNKGDVVEPSADTAIEEDNFRVNVYRATPVTIIDGNQRTVTFSAATTGRSIARQVGVNVYPEDNVTLEPTKNFLTDQSIGARVVVDRAMPVNLNLYGTPLVVRTHAKTVQELLKEKNIKLAKDDNVQPIANTPLTPNGQVFVTRRGFQIVSVPQQIPMPVQTIQDDSLSFGTTAVRQQGAPGTQVVTYQIQLENGKEVARQQIQQVVTQQPVTQIVAQGKAVQIPSDKSAVMAAAGISSADFAYADFVISHESGWRPNALNASGCAGLGQACPGSKLAAVCPNWQGDPICQLKFFSKYASKYGGWSGAYSFWLGHHYW